MFMNRTVYEHFWTHIHVQSFHFKLFLIKTTFAVNLTLQISNFNIQYMLIYNRFFNLEYSFSFLLTPNK